MLKRLISKLYRKFFLRKIIKNEIRREQEKEEYLVISNVPDSALSVLTNEEKQEVNDLFGVHYCSFKELGIFKKQNGFDPRYVSHYMYLPLIARKLNDYRYSKILEHKSLLGVLIKCKLNFPYCCVRCINGEYYNEEMNQISFNEIIDLCSCKDKIIVKNSENSSGGLSIAKYDLSSLSKQERIHLIGSIVSDKKDDFVIQDYISQSSIMSRFNPDSINTLRITTLYLNGVFSIQSIVFRIGMKGKVVDNWGAGGIMIGVSEDGKLYEWGYDIHLNKYYEYNNIRFSDERLEKIPELLNLLEEAHKCYSLCKFIGWDICFDINNNPVIIEINSSQPGIIGEQLCTGPIFGNRTKEVIDYCNSKSFFYNRSLFIY